MRKVEKMLVCDVCGVDESEGEVKKHSLKLNAKEAIGEACSTCVETKPVPELLRAFRRPGTSPRRILETVGAVRMEV